MVDLALGLVKKAIHLDSVSKKSSFQGSCGDTSILDTDVLSQCIHYYSRRGVTMNQSGRFAHRE